MNQDLEERLDNIERKIAALDRDGRTMALTQAIELVSKDMHTTSARPCPTCRFVSNVLGKPFGCYEYQARREATR